MDMGDDNIATRAQACGCFRPALISGELLLPTPVLAERERNMTRDRLLGTWSLVSWEECDAAGGVSYPLGPKPIGQRP